MRIQRGATGVLESTSHYLKAGSLKEKPAWFNVVGANPPMTDLTKKAKLFENQKQKEDPTASLFSKHSINNTYKTRVDSEDRKHVHKTVNRLPKLEFLEDQLRDVFYHQHPWEFSRPKMLVENEGNDVSKCNWSHMLQLYKPLDGESVVQRTLWLLKNKESNTLFEAYDKARFEFYRLRMEEEMSSTVSREESAMHGAVFPTSNLTWGVQQEQEYVDVWAKLGSEQTKIYEAQRGGKVNGSMGNDEVVETKLSVWEAGVETETLEIEEDQK